MMKINRREVVINSLFFGGIWGSAEATLGYLLNLSTLGLSGFVMYPIAFFILNKAYKQTNSLTVILYSSITAAAIKLINLLMPVLHPVKVLNPAFAILIEGVSIMFLLSSVINKDRNFFISALTAGLSWRIIYVIDALILYNLDIPSRMIEKGFGEYFWNFLVMNSIVNAAIIVIMLKAERADIRDSSLSNRIQPYAALCSILIGIGTQIFFSIIR